MVRPKTIDGVWRTSDEVGFLNGLDRVSLERYQRSLNARRFGPEVNVKMVRNQVMRRLRMEK